jgi:formamidopyrimidine-DNA glycosylase
MPELPEVETSLRDLEPLLRDRTVVAAEVHWPRTVAAPMVDEFLARIVGQRFRAFARRGKYMLFQMEGGDQLIVHLRMTGRLSVEPPEAAVEAHTHVVLTLEDGHRLHFRDPRKFGRIWLVADATTVLRNLGPEVWDKGFTAAALGERLAGRKAAIKALLLDQRITAGIGNIYADEVLFAAHIHPARPAGTLQPAEVKRLHKAIRTLLARAVALGGSSLGGASTNYRRPVGPDGQTGAFQAEHQVFRRTGQPCPRCGAPIERMIVAQRSTHFCPKCQPL